MKAIAETSKLLVGVGILTWNKIERVSDRYGSVWLMREGMNSVNWSPGNVVDLALPPEMEAGKLSVIVLQSRQSTHIGDFFRGLSPRTPKDGDRLTLGAGKSFRVLSDGIMSVGVIPSDGRKSDWLNPRSLYNAHESLVELWWEPTQ